MLMLEEIKEIYKNVIINKVNDDITIIDCYKSEKKEIHLYVRVVFENNRIYYTGDMGYYIFEVGNIKTFFKGERINPCYWAEKVKASDSDLINKYIEPDKLGEVLIKELLDHDHLIDKEGVLKSEVTECVDDFFNFYFDPDEIRVYDGLIELLDDLEISDGWEVAGDIIRSVQDYSYRFLYACSLLQWIENKYF